ncbi:type-F conjugative transfer system secretin TraK [Herbaspirillum huttiense]|uniref:TraK domain-containing protein n=1 Tax=Herbaspirillum huttiense TaxID=863372 RepID=UPI0039AEF8AB
MKLPKKYIPALVIALTSSLLGQSAFAQKTAAASIADATQKQREQEALKAALAGLDAKSIQAKQNKDSGSKLKALEKQKTARVAPTTLPGIGTMPGEPQPSEAQVVRVDNSRSSVVYVSGSLPNRIATPFANPVALDSQAKDFSVEQKGQSLYVTMNTSKPVGLFIQGDKPTDSIALTLVPRDMPLQVINLVYDKPAGLPAQAGEGESAPDSNVYTDKIRYNLRQIGLGKSPEGFSEAALPKAVARMGKVVAYPMTRYSGPAYDIFKYKLEATADNVELDEGSFYTAGVRAIAFFPLATLRRGEQTEMYVISDKTESE